MKKTRSLLAIIFLGLSFTLHAQQARELASPEKATGDFQIVDDNCIVAALDSLSTLKYFESTENTKNRLNANKYNFLPNFVPSYPDSV